MISVSTAYKAAANSNARQISAKIVIGQVEYDNDDIISIDFSGGNGEGGMSIGATISTRMVTVIKCMTPPTMTGYQIDVLQNQLIRLSTAWQILYHKRNS